MGDHDSPSTCLSSRPHGKDIRDNFLHYRGCLGEGEGEAFFAKLDARSQQRIRTEELRILQLRALFDGEVEETKGLAPKFESRLEYWRGCSSDRNRYWLQNSEYRQKHWEYLEETEGLPSYFKIRLEHWRRYSKDMNSSWLEKLAAREQDWEKMYHRPLRERDPAKLTTATSGVAMEAETRSIVGDCFPLANFKATEADNTDKENPLRRPPDWGFTKAQINPDPPAYTSSHQDDTASYVKPRKENGFGFYANMILFKNSDRFTDPAYADEEFPNQKISIQDLLYKKDRKTNPLMKPRKDGENEIRYFHFPGNNMEWVEEAIARHYNEERPPYDGLFRRPKDPSKTYMLLRPQFWRGQQHGGRHDAVHARHMRPRCDIISTDPKHLEETPNNLVLFMPYLHWETDRRRARFEEFMQNVTDMHKRKQAKVAASILDGILPPNAAVNYTVMSPQTQNHSNGGLNISSKSKELSHGPRTADRTTTVKPQSHNASYSLGRANPTSRTCNVSLSAQTVINGTNPATRPDTSTELESSASLGGVGQHRTATDSQSKVSWITAPPLAANTHTTSGSIPTKEAIEEELIMPMKTRTATEVLEAKIADEISKHPWSRFSQTKRGLNSQPLVPRTALGQVLYHAALLSEAMDCYHEEKLLGHYLHANPPFHPRRTIDQSYYWTLKTTKKRDRDQVVYRGTAPKKGVICQCEMSGCIHTRDNSRKVGRVLMVDQLWLWILDGNTLITSFPKRYGRNKPDPSAVHKSIRLRLKDARKNEIRSVYDLALVVLDECAKVFFDRTKTSDRKPQAMDLFAIAIGDVTHKQTIAYDHFWHTTQEASKVYKSPDTADELEDKAKSLLDINPEGKLLREIKDIQDELDIMINIKKKQVSVFQEFNNCVQYMIAQPLAVSKELGTAKPKDVTGDAPVMETNGDDNGVTRSKQQAMLNSDTQWTLQFGQDLSSRLDDRVADLQNLKSRAERTEGALDGLLTLKQQQAGVVQAREAVRQAEETLRQGRAIMLFTVITIIFLPLSFMASVFGMNSIEVSGQGPMHVAYQVKLMFTISLGVVVISFILAFSTFTRAGIAYIFDLSWTRITTATGLYAWWDESFRNGSREIRSRRKEKTREWKEQARANRQKREEEKHELLEAKERRDDEMACRPGAENV